MNEFDDSVDSPVPGASALSPFRGQLLTGVSIAAVLVGVVLVGIAIFGGDDDAPPADAAADGASSSVGAQRLNISCFSYRDIDRDGEYDLDDRPYAALRVDGVGPSSALTVASNSGGFANFEMLIGGADVLVSEPGTYRFEATPGAGWELTTPASQSVEFAELPGAPAGIVAEEQCGPFGVAPSLSISGAVPTGGTATVESAAVPADVTIVDGRRFTAPVDAGDWSVTVSDADPRTVTVADVPVVVSSLTDLDRSIPTLPNSVTLDFDDFTTANTITEIPNGYGGLDWANWVSTHRILYGGPGYVNVGASGDYVAYNSSGHPAVISSDEPFDFVGGHIGVAWPEAEQHVITIEAWRGDELVATDRFLAASSGAVYFDADYRSVTRVELSSAANWQFVVDDLELRTAS